MKTTTRDRSLIVQQQQVVCRFKPRTTNEGLNRNLYSFFECVCCCNETMFKRFTYHVIKITRTAPAIEGDSLHLNYIKNCYTLRFTYTRGTRLFFFLFFFSVYFNPFFFLSFCFSFLLNPTTLRVRRMYVCICVSLLQVCVPTLLFPISYLSVSVHNHPFRFVHRGRPLACIRVILRKVETIHSVSR